MVRRARAQESRNQNNKAMTKSSMVRCALAEESQNQNQYKQTIMHQKASCTCVTQRLWCYNYRCHGLIGIVGYLVQFYFAQFSHIHEGSVKVL
jgi:hypothetical protein